MANDIGTDPAYLAQVQAQLAVARPGALLPHAIPLGLGWDNVNFPVSPALMDPGGITPKLGSVGISPEAMFGRFSTALSAPGATFYVETTGSDSNAGTQAAPFLSWWKAFQAANAAGVPTKIVTVNGGLWYRANGPTGTSPLVDVALVSPTNRVVVGTFDNLTFALDTTFTNCYSVTLSNAERVYDLKKVDQWGNYVDLVDFGTSAGTTAVTALNAAGAVNGWAFDSTATKLYVRRADNTPVTSLNTRVARSGVSLFSFSSAVNVYMGDGGVGGIGGFDMEGGGPSGPFYYASTPPGSVLKCVAISQCTSKYGGYRAHTNANGFGVDSIYGLAYFYKCASNCNYRDGFNHHNSYSAAATYMLTVNCTAHDNGRGTATSCNGWTSHDTCVSMDVAGYYAGNHGGTVRSVNAAKALFCGTVVENDLGDTVNGGIIPPTAFTCDNTVTYWLDQCAVNMPAGTRGYYPTTGTQMLLRNVWPTHAIAGGSGTLGTW